MKRALRPIDWLVKVPLGLVWFGVLMILAVPVLLYMTVLHYVVGRVRAPRSGGSSNQGASRSEAA